ncbi:MAG: hypothetical protein WC878_00185 [Candidatus Paceibacterota bacterium]
MTMEQMKIEGSGNADKNEPVLEYQKPAATVIQHAPGSDTTKKIEETRKKIDALEDKPKKSSISRMVGNVPEPLKQKVFKNYFENIFFDKQKEKHERKKTPVEMEILSLINKMTNEVLQKYGLPVFDIPPENNHVVYKQFFEGTKWGGQHDPALQENAIQENPVRLSFMKGAFHENLHFKSYADWQILRNETHNAMLSRLGLMVITRDEGKILFQNLNEAVTEAMTKKYASGLFSHPLFKKERGETRREIANQPAGSFNEDEQYYIHKKISIYNIKKMLLGKSGREYKVESFTYPEERKILNILINKLFVKNPGKFKDENEIMEMFEKAMLTGNINSIGKLIDKTFPKKNPVENGTFRRIGEMGEDTEKLSAFVNAL